LGQKGSHRKRVLEAQAETDAIRFCAAPPENRRHSLIDFAISSLQLGYQCRWLDGLETVLRVHGELLNVLLMSQTMSLILEDQIPE